MLFQRQHPMRFFGLVILSFAVTALWRPGIAPIETARSFFGVHKVAEINGGSARVLYHGTTIHGAQRLRNDDGTPVSGAPAPQTYYYFGGPFAEAISAARAVRGSLDHVAVVGLGTGSLACHRKGREHWTFFEIDPEVIRIARDPRRFEFLSKCAPEMPVVAGDARLTLEASTDRYDLIVLDAFSSDTIPVHLLTREAVAGYLSKLTPHGVIVAHISNRHLDLAPVVANVAQSLGLAAFLRRGRQRRRYADDAEGQCPPRGAGARRRRYRQHCRELDAVAAGPIQRAVDRRLFQHPRRHAAPKIRRLKRFPATPSRHKREDFTATTSL